MDKQANQIADGCWERYLLKMNNIKTTIDQATTIKSVMDTINSMQIPWDEYQQELYSNGIITTLAGYKLRKVK